MNSLRYYRIRCAHKIFKYFSNSGIHGRYCSLLQVLLTPLTNVQLLEALDWKLMHEADSFIIEVLPKLCNDFKISKFCKEFF